MKHALALLLLMLATTAFAAPPNWDISNTYWTAQIRDAYYGFVFDGNIRFFTMNTTTGEFTGRVQYLPPNNNLLGQYDISGRVDGDSIAFRGVANIPGVGNTDVVWQGTIKQNGTRLEGAMAYWDWIWEQWVWFSWWTTSGGPARPIVRTYSISGRVELGDFVGEITGVSVVIQLRHAGSSNPIRTLTLNLTSGGAYTVPDVPNGNYDLAFKASHWLQRLVRDVQVNDANVTGVNVSLLNGDIDGDNSVTLSDFGKLVPALGSVPGDSNWDPDADLDGDQEVTLIDFSILVGNFGLEGDD